jgi:outer membrane protein OmpA-like peptidoglycan-associated protein
VKRLATLSFVMMICAVGFSQQQQDEIRKSIYFGGGSYYVDEFQIDELYNFLDSIPNALEKYDIHLNQSHRSNWGKEYNEWLSRMRSEAVQQILLQGKFQITRSRSRIGDWRIQFIATLLIKECR